MLRDKIFELCVEVAAACPKESEKYGSQGWSLKFLQTQDDVGRSNLSKGVCKVLKELRVEHAFAPHVASASAHVVTINALKEKIHLGGGVNLWRNNFVPADGIFLGVGQAFMMSGAGCPVIIAKADRQMVVAHAGRDSLIDRGAVMGTPRRKNVSVVDSIVEAFAQRGIPAEEIVMCMMFSIPADSFKHPIDHAEYGQFNQALATFVNKHWSGCVARRNGHILLDLEGLFKQQAGQLGVVHKRAIHSLDEHPSLAHTHDGKDPKRRNLIVIKRFL